MSLVAEPGLPGPDAILICEGPFPVMQAIEYKTVGLSGRLAHSLTSENQSREKDEFEPADVRMDVGTKRLVRLIRSLYTEEELFDSEEVTDMPWVVEDVLTGIIYTRDDCHLSEEIWNEMETLAWSAQDHPEIEISGD